VPVPDAFPAGGFACRAAAFWAAWAAFAAACCSAIQSAWALPGIQCVFTYLVWNQLANASSAAARTSRPMMPPAGPSFTMLPTRMPYQPKSASPKVVLAKPSDPRTVSRNAGRNEISTPLAKAPMIAPRRPPVALPKTPAAPPVKKCGTMPGRMSASPSHGPKTQARRPKDSSPPANEAMKPMSTAFGANGNTIGQSRAGTAPGTTFFEMPSNAGTSSARMVRTP